MLLTPNEIAILPISSLLATLVMIPVLLTRLFGQISCNNWSKSSRKCGLDQKSLLYVDIITDSSTETSVFSKSRSRFLTRLLLNRLFCEMHERTHEMHGNQAFWVGFRGGFSIYCALGLESWLVPMSTLIVGRPQIDDSPHLRGLLCSCCLSGSLMCPIFDLARGPVWCPRRQVVQYPKLWGRG